MWCGHIVQRTPPRLQWQGCGSDDGTLVALYSAGGGGDCAGANQQWQQRPPPLSARGSAFSLVNPATGERRSERLPLATHPLL